jgi:hypothetical protein
MSRHLDHDGSGRATLRDSRKHTAGVRDVATMLNLWRRRRKCAGDIQEPVLGRMRFNVDSLQLKVKPGNRAGARKELN